MHVYLPYLCKHSARLLLLLVGILILISLRLCWHLRFLKGTRESSDALAISRRLEKLCISDSLSKLAIRLSGQRSDMSNVNAYFFFLCVRFSFALLSSEGFFIP